MSSSILVRFLGANVGRPRLPVDDPIEQLIAEQSLDLLRLVRRDAPGRQPLAIARPPVLRASAEPAVEMGGGDEPLLRLLLDGQADVG